VGLEVAGWSPRPRPPRAAVDGRYCRIEPLDPDRHAPSLFAAVSRDHDGALWTYLPYGPFVSLEGYREWLTAAAVTDDPLFFAIAEGRTGRALGVAAYLAIEPAHGSIEVGHICFAPELQRTPAATEAMYLLMRGAFELGYRRYEWKCDTLNTPSRVAAQRLGLSFEGVFRQHRVVKGHNRDSAWYAAVDAEWPRLRAAFEQWLDPASFDELGRPRLRRSELTAPVLVRRG
jgi:RimJ/RimL family protein N-acetyltransferase